ncbi:hypothetical protein APC1482_0625 [Bifidobacterium longum]|nr:hypothetical protein APC1482_0625 [Bifidobacterium longum]
MATNVTQKDKTLQEVIDWCTDLANKLRDAPDGDFYANINANNVKADTLTLVIRHCRHLLGYGGSMPSDVPNQKRGHEMTDRRLPDAKGWYLTADHARLLRYDGYTWTTYTTDGDETELNDGYSTTADHDLLIRTLGAHRLPLTRLDLAAHTQKGKHRKETGEEDIGGPYPQTPSQRTHRQ